MVAQGLVYYLHQMSGTVVLFFVDLVLGCPKCCYLAMSPWCLASLAVKVITTLELDSVEVHEQLHGHLMHPMVGYAVDSILDYLEVQQMLDLLQFILNSCRTCTITLYHWIFDLFAAVCKLRICCHFLSNVSPWTESSKYFRISVFSSLNIVKFPFMVNTHPYPQLNP